MENIPKALQGMQPKTPCRTSSQKDANWRDGQSIPRNLLRDCSRASSAALRLLGSTIKNAIANGNKIERMPTTPKHRRHPRIPRGCFSARAVDMNCPRNAPINATKPICPKRLPRVSEGARSATTLCAIGETSDIKTAAKVRNIVNCMKVVDAAQPIVRSPQAKHPIHNNHFLDMRSPSPPHAGIAKDPTKH
mmetsp:Transcript_38162/g.61254  ORF Transcript_38162/g.61254 Transcript_38162/m.61254 type:complete len:192 (+) Transcript_38162:922-1497(+)